MNKKNKKGFTLVEIMIVVVIIGLLAAMAVPAFQKVRQTAQDKAITNNLRQFASAAQQYMLDAGVASVAYTDIVGAGLHISTINSVRSEDYSGLTIDTASTMITLDGVNYEF